MGRAAKPPIATDTPVMVLNFNGWADTIHCITELRRETFPIWLIDNGSNEDRSAELAEMFPGIRVLPLPENLGWAGGYNRALEIALSEGLSAAYLLNNDAVPQPGSIAASIKALESDPDVAAVGSIVLDHDGQRVRFAGQYYRFMSKAQRKETASSDIREARTLHGAGVLVNLRAVAALGLFHEEYFLYWEETDWFVRARQAGWKLLLCGASRVLHQSGASDSGDNAQYYMARNRFLALKRGVSVSGKVETVPGLIVETLARIKRIPRTRVALEDGLLDGLAGRFGKRGAGRRPVIRRTLIGALSVATIGHRLLRRLTRVRSASKASGPASDSASRLRHTDAQAVP